MTERTGHFATALTIAISAAVLFGGIWFANRAENDDAGAADVVTTPPTTAGSSVPETMLVVTLPTTTSTTTTTEPAPATTSTPTTTTTLVSYWTAEEQIDYFTSGPERERVIADLTSLTPYVVSIDELTARHDQFGPVLIDIDDDGSAPNIRSTPAGIVVSLTSEFSGAKAVAEEAWEITKYFAPLWASGEPVRLSIDTSSYGDRLDTFVGYALEINIGRHSYQTTGPVMAAIADVEMGFAEWERHATLEWSD